MKKKIIHMILALVSLLGLYSSIGSVFANSTVNQAMLQVGGGDYSANANTNVTFKENFIRNIQVYMMGLLGVISVSVFVYIGYTLFTAQGNEESFKKAWTSLIYAIVGLAVIPLAFILVKIVTGFTF